MKNKIETLLQEKPILNETDLYETDDPVLKRISNTSQDLHTLIFEIQYQKFNDIHLSQDILSNITNSSSNINKHNNTKAITQTPNKPTSTQSLSFFDPFFMLKANSLNFFPAIRYSLNITYSTSSSKK